MMIKKSLVALAITALLFPVAIAGVKAERSKFSPTVGERLNYDVSWSDFIVAGELTLETKALETKDRRSFDDAGGFHVTAQAQSVGLVSAVVYKVNDIYESFVSAATLQPFRAEKNSRRGKKRQQASVTIDQQKRTARLGDGRTIEIPADTYDLAGLIFAIRAMDLTQGKSRVFNVLEEDKLYKISVEPEASERIITPAGTFDAIRMTTKTIGGAKDSNLYNLKLYVTNDARRLPVQITAEPSWGSVRVRLTSIAGTRTTK
ncbi:MAG: DUF3108 domain-containing protein [Blastocatellia bacterium]